jgi:hypothetical protein
MIRVMMQSVAIEDVPAVTDKVKLVQSVHEAQRLAKEPSVAAIIHITCNDERPAVNIELTRETLDGFLQHIMNREMTTLNRMGVDIQEDSQ